MRDSLEAELLRTNSDSVLVATDAQRLPNTTLVAMPGKQSETLVIKLDLAGIAVSAGAACSSGKVGTSHVLEAMGVAPEIARGAVRVSLGPSSTTEDVQRFVAAWNAATGRPAMAA